ncbi:MAG: hypothetical protein PVSMB4_15140 [Ktedonobacterales bacterium]
MPRNDTSTQEQRERPLNVRVEAARFGSFLLVGGTATALNLTVVGTLTILAHWTYLPAALIATEAGLMLSFLLNDRLTFRALSGAAGSWVMRCLRFHGASLVGQGLTLLIAGSLNQFLRWPALAAQAFAIALVLGFNFTVMRLWTYRARARPAVELAAPHR